MRSKIKQISAETVRELFDYRDGKLYWKINPNRTIKAGALAGHIMKKSQRYAVMIKRQMFLGHRLIFLWHHGYAPNEIDHKDRNMLNNHIENLRECTTSQNHANETHRKNTKNVYRGLQRGEIAGKVYWGARIMINGKRKHLGMFRTPEEAAKAYNDASLKHFGEFANLNPV